MKLYIESADGSLYDWDGSIIDLEEKILGLLNRGYTVKVRVL